MSSQSWDHTDAGGDDPRPRLSEAPQSLRGEDVTERVRTAQALLSQAVGVGAIESATTALAAAISKQDEWHRIVRASVRGDKPKRTRRGVGRIKRGER